MAEGMGVQMQRGAARVGAQSNGAHAQYKLERIARVRHADHLRCQAQGGGAEGGVRAG